MRYSYARTILNSPITDGAFVLKIESGTGEANNYVRQIIKRTLTDDEYQRSFDRDNSTWSAWKKAPTRDEFTSLNNSTAITVTGATGVTISVNKSVLIGNSAWLIVKGKADSAIVNQTLFTFSGVNLMRNAYTLPIGIGSEWDITDAGYGYIAQNNLSARIAAGAWFHICACLPIK